MNKIEARIFWVGILIVGLLPGAGARAQQAPPKPPYIGKLPDSFQYDMIESTGGKGKHSGGAAALHLTKISIAKKDETKQVTGEWSNGKSSEAWIYKGMALVQQEKPPGVTINTVDNTASNLPLGNGDFQGLEWVGANTYKNTDTIEGKPCYVFEQSPGTANALRAWVDVKTGLPASLEEQGITYRFKYGSAPAEALELPPVFAQAWQNYENSMKTVTAGAPQPPYLAKLPDFSRYEMNDTAPSKPGGPVHLTRVVVTKTGATKQYIGYLSNGKSIEAWMYRGMVMVQQLSPPDVIINTYQNMATNLPIAADDFADLEWLSRDTYKSEATFEGKKSYLFEQKADNGNSAQAWRAVIDQKTKLPLVLQRAETIYHYKYDEPPTEELQLSPAFAKGWQNYQDSLSVVTSKPRPR